MVQIVNRSCTLKERAFAEAYVICRDVSKAYHTAGYDPNRREGNYTVKAKLKLQKPRIQKYIAEVEERRRQVNKMEITHDRIIDMLVEDREFARDCKSPAAAISATKLLGQSIGMFKNSAEVVNNNITVGNQMDESEIEAFKHLFKNPNAVDVAIEK